MILQNQIKNYQENVLKQEQLKYENKKIEKDLYISIKNFKYT